MFNEGIRRNFSPENYDQMINSDDTGQKLILAMDVNQGMLGRSSNASEGKVVVNKAALEKAGINYQFPSG